jgi:hypothetical protein
VFPGNILFAGSEFPGDFNGPSSPFLGAHFGPFSRHPFDRPAKELFARLKEDVREYAQFLWLAGVRA